MIPAKKLATISIVAKDSTAMSTSALTTVVHIIVPGPTTTIRGAFLKKIALIVTKILFAMINVILKTALPQPMENSAGFNAVMISVESSTALFGSKKMVSG